MATEVNYQQLQAWKRQIMQECESRLMLEKDATEKEKQAYLHGVRAGMNEILSTLRIQQKIFYNFS